MWEFLTEWSDNDPKYYVVYIIVGSLSCLITKNSLDFNKPRRWNDSKGIILFIAGAILIFVGLYSIIRDLITVI